MKFLDYGLRHDTEVMRWDTETKDGSCGVEYTITDRNLDKGKIPTMNPMYGMVKFQDGPIAEKGVNGCQVEDLIAISIDRISQFQMGGFPCNENKIAIDNLERALAALDQRTLDRRRRELEGVNKV